MKPELKVKFLQHLNQKKQDEGFTLIELLVVIIIIGILAAIALPSFLSQSNKAKQSEAKTYVGSMNKGQQAYFTEKGAFGTDISSLGIGIKTQTVNYTYSSTTVGAAGTGQTGVSFGSLVATGSGLKSYSGMVSLTQVGSASDVTSIATLCEVITPGAQPTAPATGASCGTGMVAVGG